MYKKRTIVIAVVLSAVVTFSLTRAYDKFFETTENGNLLRAKNIITDNYVEELTREQITKMEDAAITAMVESLNDPYSRYLNKEGYEDYEEDNEEEYVGVGISVVFDYKDNQMVVTSPYENAPAQKAGVLPGDIIRKIDGVEVNSETYNDVVDHIREGEIGETVNLQIERDDKSLTIPVTREKVIVQTVSSKMLDGDIGYIRISQFIQHTEADFNNALDELSENGMKALVLDLRSNPGGYANTVLSIANTILPKGTIAYLEDKQGKRQYFNSDAKCVDVPMAVLINRGTASAAELLAGSIKAYELGTIIGEKSFGKAVGQSPYTLIPSKTAIYLTNARYFTPKGECIDKVGIEPDIKVGLSDELLAGLPYLEMEEDAQLVCAVNVLNEELNDINN